MTMTMFSLPGTHSTDEHVEAHIRELAQNLFALQWWPWDENTGMLVFFSIIPSVARRLESGRLTLHNCDAERSAHRKICAQGSGPGNLNSAYGYPVLSLLLSPRSVTLYS